MRNFSNLFAAVLLVALTTISVTTSPVGATFVGWGDPVLFGQVPPLYSISTDPAFQKLTLSKILVCYKTIMILSENGDLYWMGSMYPTVEGDINPPLNYTDRPLVINELVGEPISDISCTEESNTAFFALQAGYVRSWGFEFHGRLGRGGSYNLANDNVLFPTPGLMTLPLTKPPIKVVASPLTTMVILADGTVLAFGHCHYWCLTGTETFSAAGITIAIPGEPIVDISTHNSLDTGYYAQSNQTIVCTAMGNVYTFGAAWQGLMTPAADLVTSPYLVPLPTGSYCKKVFAAQFTSLVLLQDGKIYSGGSWYYGMVGRYDSNPTGRVDIPTMPDFPARDMFVTGSGDYGGNVIAIGVYNSVKHTFVWGDSPSTRSWLGPDFPTILPQESSIIASHIAENPSAFPIYCHGTRTVGACISSERRAWAWGDYSNAIASGIPAIAAFKTPSAASNFPILLGTGNIVVNIFNSRGGNIFMGPDGTLRYWTSPTQANTASSISRNVANPFSSDSSIVEVVPSGYPSDFALLANGSVIFYTRVTFDGADWGEFTMFLNTTEFVVRSIKPVTASLFGGMLALVGDSDLYWFDQEPWTGAAGNSTAHPDGLYNLLNPSAVFPLFAPPGLRVVKIWGEYQSYFMLDQYDNIWAIGDNSFGQLCFNDSGPGVQSPAHLLNFANTVVGSGRIVDIIILSSNSTVIVASNGLFGCGDDSRWDNLVGYPAPMLIPVPLSPGETIEKASLSALNSLAFTSDDNLFAIGLPYLDTEWTAISNISGSAVKGRIPRLMVALPFSGGYFVSEMKVTEDPSRRIIDSTAIMKIYGSSFGVTGDGRIADVVLQQGSNTRGAFQRDTACFVVSRTARTITCMLSQDLLYDTTNSEYNNVRAVVRIDDEEFSALIGYIVPAPTLNSTTSQWIARNADQLTLTGSGFGSNIIVTLSFGECNITSVTETEIVCRLILPGGSIPSDQMQASARTPEQDARSAPLQIVATVVPPPSITTTLTKVPSGTDLFTIPGVGFNPKSPSQKNQVWIRVDQGPWIDCPVLDEGASSTQLLCRISNTNATKVASGTVTAYVRSYNGNSEERAIASIGTDQVVATPEGLSMGAIGGIIGGVLAFVLILAILAFLVIRKRMRLNIIKGQAAVDVPAEMASMFNIKSSDLEIVKKLGEGSFGAVFLCKWKGRMVALKKLTGSMLSSHINDFFREAALMTGIPPHKNVVRIYGMCQEMNNFSLVMEYLQKGSLDSYVAKELAEGGAVNWDPVMLYRVVIGIARGMAHLAGQGVVHRDLAARNILLSGNCEPKVSDFGMSRVVGADQNVGQTQSNVGPIRWMPPESLAQRLYSEKSDVWSYGVLLYEILTGHEPFENEEMLQVAVEVRDSGRTVLTKISKDELAQIPPYIHSLMETCFHGDPNERPTFHAIVEYLHQYAPPGYTEAADEDNVVDHDEGHAKGKKGKKQTNSAPPPAATTNESNNEVEMKQTSYTSMPSV